MTAIQNFGSPPPDSDNHTKREGTELYEVTAEKVKLLEETDLADIYQKTSLGFWQNTSQADETKKTQIIILWLIIKQSLRNNLLIIK